MPASAPSSRSPLRAVFAALIAIAVSLSLIAVPASASATSKTANGITTAGGGPSAVRRGRSITVQVDVRSASTRSLDTRLRIVDASGALAHQRRWGTKTIAAGRTQTYAITWKVPSTARLGEHRVRVTISRPDGGGLQHWNADADRFSVQALRFGTRPPGATLPKQSTCGRQVRAQAEIRPANRAFNQTTGRVNTALAWPYSRASGNFTGTTDEIIQWAACKWGFDEDIVRAQTAKESWWFQSATGDYTSNASACAPGHPIGRDGRPGQCPESIGMQQIRWQYWRDAFPWAGTSTAYNLDYAMAARRDCFEGNWTWLNTVERGRQYRAGDLWGCVGAWFSGRWYTDASVQYINEVKRYLADRIWETPEFRNAS